MDSQRINTLQKPLLGDDNDNSNNSYNNKSSFLTTTTPATATAIETAVYLTDNSDDEKNVRVSCCDNLVAFLILPVLLFAQFGIIFLAGKSVDTRLGGWSSVNYSITLFIITSFLYRKAAQDCNVLNIIMLLIPEIIMDIVLTLVLINKVFIGFIFLLISTLVMSLFVVLSSLYLLCFVAPKTTTTAKTTSMICYDGHDEEEERA